MPRFRNKNAVNAIQYTGDVIQVENFLGVAITDSSYNKKTKELLVMTSDEEISLVSVGDWVVIENGELFVADSADFEANYEPI